MKHKADTPGKPPLKLTERRWWPWVSRGVFAVFLVAVIGLLAWQASQIDWPAVLDVLKRYPASVLAFAACTAVAGHVAYACFDLLGRRYSGHTLPTRRVMPVTFVSYAFGLNFGAVVGSAAMRYRLFSRLGLDNATITRVMLLAMWTNWFGYLVLAGVAFLVLPVALPPDWPLDEWMLRALGAALLCVAGAYLAMCAWSRRRVWQLRGHDAVLPTLRLALAQLALSVTNWLLIACVIWILLMQQIPFLQVASVLLVGVVIGILTRVPAGLGVQEAVFVALLSHQLPAAQLLAALLAYRALYYWTPLVIATVVYLVMESRAKRGRGEAALPADPRHALET